jgi:hypothetical protein
MEQIKILARVPMTEFRKEFQKVRPRFTVWIRLERFSMRLVPKRTLPLMMSILLLVAAETIQKKGKDEKKQVTVRNEYIAIREISLVFLMIPCPPL